MRCDTVRFIVVMPFATAMRVPMAVAVMIAAAEEPGARDIHRKAEAIGMASAKWIGRPLWASSAAARAKSSSSLCPLRGSRGERRGALRLVPRFCHRRSAVNRPGNSI